MKSCGLPFPRHISTVKTEDPAIATKWKNTSNSVYSSGTQHSSQITQKTFWNCVPAATSETGPL